MAPLIQSVLHPAGVQAARLNQLWWVMFWVCTVVFICVMCAVALAIVRGRRGSSTASEATLTRTVGAAVGISVVALLVLLTASEITGRDLEALKSQSALRIQITGNQWFWSYAYPDNGNIQFSSVIVPDEKLAPEQRSLRLLAVDQPLVLPTGAAGGRTKSGSRRTRPASIAGSARSTAGRSTRRWR